MKKRIIAFVASICLLVGLLPMNVFAYTKGYDGMGPVVVSGGRRDFKWPVPGHYNLQSCFYDHRNHCAIDISAPLNTPAVASYEGTVLRAVDGGTNYYGDGFGNYVVLQHSYALSDGTITLYTRYSHLNSVSVKKGDTVQAGAEVGKIGTTGSSEAYHLDFQILYGDWQPYQTYSIDPYANQLLELPSTLAIYDSWACGKSYYELVKELYATPLIVTKTYPSYCAIKVTADTAPIRNMPCSEETDPSVARLEIASKGDRYQAIELVENIKGNLWYKVKTKSGGTGYIYAGNTTYLAKSVNDIKASDVTVPTNHTVGKVYSLTGSVSSQYNQLTGVSVYIYNAQGTQATGAVASVSGNYYSFGGSAIDNKTEFNKLSVGTYTYVVSASYINYYAKSAKTVGTNAGAIDVYTATFNVTKAAVSCSHSYSSKITTAATCESNGVRTYTCSKCSASYTEVIPATGMHSYTSIVTAPACITQGYTTYTCTVCGYYYVDDFTAAIGHAFTNESKDPTCTENGYDKISCLNCGYYKEDTLSATGHSYTAVTTAPTCTAQGYTTYICTKCSNSYVSDYTAVAGHEYTSHTIAPTCTAQGYTTYTCTKCNNSYVSDYTAVAGHAYTSHTKAPTCTAQGYTTYTCTKCNDSYVSDYIASAGHSFKKGYSVYYSPSLVKSGTLIGRCDNCSHTDYVTLPALNATQYVYTVLKNPTCVEKGLGQYTWSDPRYGSFNFEVTIPKSDPELGDVNADAKITIGDVSALLNFLSDTTQKPAGVPDINQDGVITVGDVTMLLNMLAGATE